ncbi:hypothetical protein [Priestia megaterium]|uniref:hypothetical protein n=1 Tax=Priestia megaterium TaxID=1404 RepID=UPI0031FD6ECC
MGALGLKFLALLCFVLLIDSSQLKEQNIKIPQGCDTFIWLTIVAVLSALNQLLGLIKNTSDVYFKVKEEVQKSRTRQDINSE